MNSTFVILTGGKSSRFGSDKSAIVLGGVPLIERILKNLPAGPVIIMGPRITQNIREVTFMQEEPVNGGPVAAIAAALPLIRSSELCVIATDMPFSGHVVTALIASSMDSDALIPTDSTGKRQPLCARYKRVALENAIAKIGSSSGKSMRAVLEGLDITEFKNDLSFTNKIVDIDTPEDLANVIRNFSEELEAE